MKTYLSKNQAQHGSVLLVTMLITGIAGFALASYLTLVSMQNRSIVRSQSWNMDMPIVEAGIEEALTHLNDNCNSYDLAQMGKTVNWITDGWQSTSSGYTKTTTLPDGSYYIVNILTAAPNSPFSPAILSEGHVNASPLALSRPAFRPDAFFAVIGDTSPSGYPNTSTTTSLNLAPQPARKVRVTVSNPGLFAKGIVALDYINLNGNGVTSDSFDSSNPLYSLNGQYNVTYRRDHGDIATVSGLTNIVNLDLGNANIWGSALTGPGGTLSIGSNGKVGDAAWQNSGSSGVQSNHFSQDMNLSFPDVKVPFTGNFLTPSGGTLTVTNITTSTTTFTTNSYPSGKSNVTTNYVTTTSASYPPSWSYLGTVTTNVVQANNAASYPASGTYVDVVATNTSTTTSAGYPAGGYLGTPQTNTVSTTSSNYPPSGTYVGGVVTNLGTFTTTSYPSQHVGNVTTNAAATSSTTYPAAGTYVGKVTTRVVSNGPPSGRGTWYDYNAIVSYTWQNITGYTYNAIISYTWQRITGYSYSKIVSYTYAQITDYSWSMYTFTTNYSTTTYDYILDDGNYKLSVLNGTAYVRGNAILYVTDTLNFSGINIGTGSLKLFSGASSASLGGNGVVNQPGYATNFFFYGLPTCTSVSLSGNGGFTGCIYVPEADLTLTGGGNNTVDFIGAGVFKTITMNGHFNFHYDESLYVRGPGRGFLINSWAEVPLSQQQ